MSKLAYLLVYSAPFDMFLYWSLLVTLQLISSDDQTECVLHDWVTAFTKHMHLTNKIKQQVCNHMYVQLGNIKESQIFSFIVK